MTIKFHFWSIQSITITTTQKTVIDCNRLLLTITITPCLFDTVNHGILLRKLMYYGNRRKKNHFCILFN